MKSEDPTSSPALRLHAKRLVTSYRLLTGRDLISAEPPESLPKRLFEAPFVVISHNREADPVLNYGNRAALKLWDMTWEEFTQTPSRLTAETPEREEREHLLALVRERGFIDDYSGVRISRTGRRFRIEKATVWNLLDENGTPVGQAATFSRWVDL